MVRRVKYIVKRGKGVRIGSSYFKRKYSYSNKKNYAILILFITLFFGVGYAYLNTMLTINGTATVAKNIWDVHFENIVKVDGSVTATSEATITGDTAVDFTVDLTLPGDIYSFTVDVVNDGTIDAMLSEVLKTGLTTSQEAYVEYTVTYSDGEEILSNDALPSGEQDQLLVSVKYKDDIDRTALPDEDQSVELNLSTDYIQDDGTSTDRRPSKSRILYDEIIIQNQENGEMVLDNEASTYVSESTGIDFYVEPSDTNGKGVYVKSGTENDAYPIYYYRGEVTNNNVVFGGYCWKIVRTTETGGVKLIYNGVYEHYAFEPIEFTEYINVANDETNPYTYDSTTKNWISTSNHEDYIEATITFSVATVGDYEINYVLSSEFNYDFALFYLDDKLIGEYSGEESGSISLGHLTPSNVIKVLYKKDGYEYSPGGDTVRFNVSKKTGELIEMSCNNTREASQIGISEFNASSSVYYYNAGVGYMYGTPNSSTYEEEHLSTKESTSSTIKTYIDDWYSQNMTNYTHYLEDTVWCNDRSFDSHNTGTGAGRSDTDYSAMERNIYISYTPLSLECANQNDRFTVNETVEGRVNGNGALTHPVALLTADELTLSGQGYYGCNTKNYLYTGRFWWSLSPISFSQMASMYYVIFDSLYQEETYVYNSYGVRPAVSLLVGTRITKDGDGSVNNPFIVQ